MYCNTYIQFRTQKPSLGCIFFIIDYSGEDSRSAPSSTVTRPSKSGNGQATMTVAVPQEPNKHQVQTHELRVLPVVNVNRGSIRVTRRNEGMLPPQSIPVKHDCVSLGRGGSV